MSGRRRTRASWIKKGLRQCLRWCLRKCVHLQSRMCVLSLFKWYKSKTNVHPHRPCSQLWPLACVFCTNKFSPSPSCHACSSSVCITRPAALMGLPAWVRGLYRPVMRLDSILLTSLLNRLKVTHVQFFIAKASKSVASTR